MKNYLLGLVLILLFVSGWSQKAEINLGKTKIALNEVFQITLTLHNDKFTNRSDFPRIASFQEAGTSSSSSYNFVNGRRSSTQSVIQNYKPTKQGTFTLAPFTITINGQKYNSPGTKITVGPAKQQQQRSRDPFSDPFFNRRQSNYDFRDVEDDAFLGISTSSNSIYEGEGLHLEIAFYATRTDFQFIDFQNDVAYQVQDMLQELKLANTWMEDFEHQIQLKAERVVINGREFFKVKLAELMLFPQNSNNLKIPSLGLDMTKYKSAGVTNIWGDQVKGQGETKTFKTKPKLIKVKALPPHPLKDRVAVGQYRLSEEISDTAININDSFIYTFSIKGRGNLHFSSAPTQSNTTELSIFKPITDQNVKKGNGQVFGNKTFNYDILPEEPGEFNMANYFSWIYFDPSKGRYDTLTPKASIRVTGESRKNENIASSDLGVFYDLIDSESNKLITSNDQDWLKYFANSVILFMFASGGFLVFWHRRRKKKNG